MPYFDYSKLNQYGYPDYVNYSLRDVVPVNYIEDERWVAFYEINRIEKRGSDLAGYDDGKHYTLRLVRVEKIDETTFNEILLKVTPKGKQS